MRTQALPTIITLKVLKVFPPRFLETNPSSSSESRLWAKILRSVDPDFSPDGLTELWRQKVVIMLYRHTVYWQYNLHFDIFLQLDKTSRTQSNRFNKLPSRKHNKITSWTAAWCGSSHHHHHDQIQNHLKCSDLELCIALNNSDITCNILFFLFFFKFDKNHSSCGWLKYTKSELKWNEFYMILHLKCLHFHDIQILVRVT